MSGSLVPVILAGGKGERFWPVSRRSRPKQFLSLDGSGKTLLQNTADRLLPLAESWDRLWVITASHLADGVRQQLSQLPEANLLVEPQGRDTAPAVAWTVLEIVDRLGEDTVVGFFPADHAINNDAAFQNTLKSAAQLASKREAIVTLGIEPTYPATGYGYIERGESVGEFNSLAGYTVTRFTEKPDKETASQFLETGRYSWNSGMFVFRAGTMLSQLRQHAPEMTQLLEKKGVDAYGELDKTSIDYAVMEKTDLACVLPVSFGWDDLGDWNAVERLLKREGDRNLELAKVVDTDSEGCIFYSSDPDETIVTIGLEDVVVVRDKGVTLIVKKDRTQEIKKALGLVKDNPDLENLL